MVKILDACCGSKMFWFDKNHRDTIFMDNRELKETLCEGRKLIINPDVVADFREMPFSDNSFYLVVFDPPHLLRAGENSWLRKKYGILESTWQNDIKQGFRECMRVLNQMELWFLNGDEEQIKLKEILSAIEYKPLFGNKKSKTHWLIFMKD